MAAGEYVSVSSQSDTEQADLSRERAELATQPEFEREELARIYIDRSVSPDLAQQVADQLIARDALGAHTRIQAALTSAATFAVAAAMSLAMVLLIPRSALVVGATVASRLFLALLGAIGARAGGANVMEATLRVTFWGALAMTLTAGTGALFGTVV